MYIFLSFYGFEYITMESTNIPLKVKEEGNHDEDSYQLDLILIKKYRIYFLANVFFCYRFLKNWS